MNSVIGRVHLAEENNKAPGRPQMWSPGPALFYGSWTLRDYAAGTPEGDLDPMDSALWGGDILRKEMVPRRTPKWRAPPPRAPPAPTGAPETSAGAGTQSGLCCPSTAMGNRNTPSSVLHGSRLVRKPGPSSFSARPCAEAVHATQAAGQGSYGRNSITARRQADKFTCLTVLCMVEKIRSPEVVCMPLVRDRK